MGRIYRFTASKQPQKSESSQALYKQCLTGEDVSIAKNRNSKPKKNRTSESNHWLLTSKSMLRAIFFIVRRSQKNMLTQAIGCRRIFRLFLGFNRSI